MPGAAAGPVGATVSVRVAGLAGTHAVAAAVAERMHAGDLIVLTGGLGAGKTAFTQGLAHALGVGEPVTSPTFTLVHPYRTRSGTDLLHVDVYRLESMAEVIELGLPELLEEDAYAVVEWGERAVAALAAEYLSVTILPAGTDTGRTIRLDAVGASWSARCADLLADLPPSDLSAAP